jgi:hypothetical protein
MHNTIATPLKLYAKCINISNAGDGWSSGSDKCIEMIWEVMTAEKR